MFWRKHKTEDTSDLRTFVEGMKRGVTLHTSDSLLETLRQIHDRREAPAAGHDHRRMLLERLRREMRVRSGEAVADVVWVPQFAAPAPRRRFIEWAVAASVLVHVALGAYVLTQHFRVEGGIDQTASTTVQTDVPGPVFWLPKVNERRDPNQRVVVNGSSVGANGHSRQEVPAAPSPTLSSSAVPTISATPVGPPVLPGGGAPIVPGFSSGGLEGQADRNLPESIGPGVSGPDEPRPFTEVSPFNVDRADPISADFDLAPRALNRPKPIYTEKALRYQINGNVRVKVTIGSDGSVRDVQVTRSLGYGLDEAALDAIRRTRFSPAMRNGMPVTVRVSVDVTFEIH